MLWSDEQTKERTGIALSFEIIILFFQLAEEFVELGIVWSVLDMRQLPKHPSVPSLDRSKCAKIAGHAS